MTVLDLPVTTRDDRGAGVDGVPCAARPSTRFRHLDGPCRCFVGGPAPEFGPSLGAAGSRWAAPSGGHAQVVAAG